jgi:exosortase
VLLALLGLLLAACYGRMLRMTAEVIASDEDMACGLVAPVIAVYLGWKDRQVILRPTSDSSIWSLALLGFAACLGIAATLANSSTFARMAWLISLAGCLLLLGGGTALRRFLFPLSLLLFTFPIPPVMYGELTQPLQLLATRLSEAALEGFGFSVLREGNVLQLPHMQLSVVEACSGLRSLITLLFACLVYSRFFEPRLWVATWVTALAIPSAILVNMVRITATGILGSYNHEWTAGLYHESLGWLAVSLGFILVIAAHSATLRLLRSAKTA